MADKRASGSIKPIDGDIVVSPSRGSKAEAVDDWKSHVETLNRLGRGQSHGLFVAKYGRGWAVYLRDRGGKDPFDMG